MNDFAVNLLAWFDQNGRKDLPWQQSITPYKVWVSEIMLQQTQVKTVIPYFEKFMQRFPTIAELANATQDDVMHLWAGLGYYTRARNLHTTARKIMEYHNGAVPLRTPELEALPGIGRSTAAAIAAICTGQRVSILDGNVKRVIARIFAIKGWPGKSKTINELWRKAEELTPCERVADYTQAIMDLGAMVCTPSKPRCHTCPFEQECEAYLTKAVDLYPGKKPKKKLPTRQVTMLVIESIAGVLLEKRPESGIWGGLWSFPEISANKPEDLIKNLGYKTVKSVRLAPLRHSFTHYHLDIQPVHVIVEAEIEVPDRNAKKTWFDPDNPSILGLSGVVTKILQSR